MGIIIHNLAKPRVDITHMRAVAIWHAVALPKKTTPSHILPKHGSEAGVTASGENVTSRHLFVNE